MNNWFLELKAGVFVGKVSSRVRDYVWEEVARWVEECPDPEPYAVLVCQAETEQGMVMRTAGQYAYAVADFGGIQLVTRQHRAATPEPNADLPDESW